MLTEKYYKRSLPHWQKPNRSIFLTWRLFGSLPDSFHPVPSAKPNGPGAQFLHLDRCLDAACFGPQWLKDPRIARIVVAAINRGERDLHHYSIVAFTVMSNHVHLLIRPLVPLREITKGLKGSTARHTNALLGLTGSPFWQDETFDHWTRDDIEEQKIARYIGLNPVRAGLAKVPEDWPWTRVSMDAEAR